MDYLIFVAKSLPYKVYRMLDSKKNKSYIHSSEFEKDNSPLSRHSSDCHQPTIFIAFNECFSRIFPCISNCMQKRWNHIYEKSKPVIQTPSTVRRAIRRDLFQHRGWDFRKNITEAQFPYNLHDTVQSFFDFLRMLSTRKKILLSICYVPDGRYFAALLSSQEEQKCQPLGSDLLRSISLGLSWYNSEKARRCPHMSFSLTAAVTSMQSHFHNLERSRGFSVTILSNFAGYK